MSIVVPWEESQFFKGSPPEALKQIRNLVKEASYSSGQTIFREGDPASDLFLLKSGRLELSYGLPTRPDASIRITMVHPGEIFGWSALAGGQTLTAGALAVESSEVFLIPAAPLRGVMEEIPRFGYLVMNRLAVLIASRLKDTRTQLQWLHAF